MPVSPGTALITLLTDFGARDHFAGVMKGVIASLAPGARVIDISHEVEPFRVEQARFLLAQSWPYFPARTVHVVVVDPGVGGARRPLLVEADGHRFVGPDNGVFSDVLALPKARARHITNEALFLKPVSATFHGRDVFAPVAARLASGLTPSRVGPRIHDAQRSTTGAPVRTGKRFWTGEVAHVDRFGNLITNLAAWDFPHLAERGFLLRVGLVALDTLAPNYASAPPGEPVVVVGSSGHLEITLNQERADRKLGVGPGSPVELEVF